MKLIRALHEIKIGGIAIPYNRVAHVDEKDALACVENGMATEEEKHIDQALLMNPEVIDICGGYVGKVKTESNEFDNVNPEETDQQPVEEEQPESDKTKTAKK